jgi:hypothetical protein
VAVCNLSVSARPESVLLFVSVVNRFVGLFHIVQLFIVSSIILHFRELRTPEGRLVAACNLSASAQPESVINSIVFKVPTNFRYHRYPIYYRAVV